MAKFQSEVESRAGQAAVAAARQGRQRRDVAKRRPGRHGRGGGPAAHRETRPGSEDLAVREAESSNDSRRTVEEERLRQGFSALSRVWTRSTPLSRFWKCKLRASEKRTLNRGANFERYSNDRSDGGVGGRFGGCRRVTANLSNRDLHKSHGRPHGGCRSLDYPPPSPGTKDGDNKVKVVVHRVAGRLPRTMAYFVDTLKLRA